MCFTTMFFKNSAGIGTLQFKKNCWLKANLMTQESPRVDWRDYNIPIPGCDFQGLRCFSKTLRYKK